MSAAFAKTERLSCRISTEGKRLLEHVAARHGMSISEYFVSVAVEAAGQELLEEIVIRIPSGDWDSLLTELDADVSPNAKLIDAAKTFAQGHFAQDIYHAPD